MTRRARVDRTAAMYGLGVLRQVRRDVHLPQGRHKVARVVSLVARHGDAMLAAQLADHGDRRLTLGAACRRVTKALTMSPDRCSISTWPK